MSASAEAAGRPRLVDAEALGSTCAQGASRKIGSGWNPEEYFREQIRGLVRRLFFNSNKLLVKQVVFSATDPEIDVGGICLETGQALAMESSGEIAVVTRDAAIQPIEAFQASSSPRPSIQSWSQRLGLNVWRVPEFGLRVRSERAGTGEYWIACLAQLRDEFEYALIEGPVAGMASEAALMGELADGIVLVLGARTTRRATARKAKEALEGAGARILGSVLSDRSFPIPDRIYRRL